MFGSGSHGGGVETVVGDDADRDAEEPVVGFDLPEPVRAIPPSELRAATAALDAALEKLSAIDFDGADPDHLAEATLRVHNLRDRLDAHVARADAAAWRAGLGTESAVNTAAWLTKGTGSSRKSIARSLRLGRELSSLPVVQAAWESGDLSTAKVERIAAAANPRTRRQLAADQAFLVGWSRRLPYFEVDRMVTVWSLHADPDGAEQRHDKRNVWLTESVDGMFLGNMTLDPVRDRHETTCAVVSP